MPPGTAQNHGCYNRVACVGYGHRPGDIKPWFQSVSCPISFRAGSRPVIMEPPATPLPESSATRSGGVSVSTDDMV